MGILAERGNEILLESGVVHPSDVAEEIRNHTFNLWQHCWNREFKSTLDVSGYRCFKDADTVRKVSVEPPFGGQLPQQVCSVEVYEQFFHVARCEVLRVEFVGYLIQKCCWQVPGGWPTQHEEHPLKAIRLPLEILKYPSPIR